MTASGDSIGISMYHFFWLIQVIDKMLIHN
jgi:hypothetical protein